MFAEENPPPQLIYGISVEDRLIVSSKSEALFHPLCVELAWFQMRWNTTSGS